MTVNRETERDTLAGLLTTAVQTAIPGAAVFGYRVGDLGGRSPVVTVVSAGSERPRMTMQGSRATFYFVINLFTLYALKGGTWTEALAEDQLDLLEKTVAATLAANCGPVRQYNYEQRSDASMVTDIGGNAYRWEAIPVKVEVYT